MSVAILAGVTSTQLLSVLAAFAVGAVLYLIAIRTSRPSPQPVTFT